MATLLGLPILIFTFSNRLTYASTKLSTIQKATGYVSKQPFAVRYKISDRNFFAENLRKAYFDGTYDGKSDVGLPRDYNVARDFGKDCLINECLYVSDGQGNERFQSTRLTEPVDVGLYPDLISTTTVSVTLLSDYTILREQKRNGQWYRGIQIQDPNYRVMALGGAFRFPLFGLAIMMWEGLSGMKSVSEAIPPILQKRGQTAAAPFDCLEIESEPGGMVTTIEWNDSPIPSQIRCDSKSGQSSTFYSVLEVGKTTEGYVYPKKAKRQMFVHNSLWRETTIDVTDIIIGPEALKKYPLLIPAPANAVVSDERTDKSKEVDPKVLYWRGE